MRTLLLLAGVTLACLPAAAAKERSAAERERNRELTRRPHNVDERQDSQTFRSNALDREQGQDVIRQEMLKAQRSTTACPPGHVNVAGRCM
ncbi:MAG: hypothetical protein JO157_02015 [Acetobacteraceae bacterium]|nr:hypothetical protein [Acetobacteraceae bacterium]